MPTFSFSYEIVPRDGNSRQPIAGGNLFASSLDAAKKYVQSVRAPTVDGKSGLEVILRDLAGTEIWRGPYLGSD